MVNKSEALSASCSLYSREGGRKIPAKRTAVAKGLGWREFGVFQARAPGGRGVAEAGALRSQRGRGWGHPGLVGEVTSGFLSLSR